mmetsp:Transcript_14323/g.30077  ORF Transcript_14323/g.30077 Transcript_14323/m.30077 type:complete len:147 (-) Transcript_14323:2193-2633(-)
MVPWTTTQFSPVCNQISCMLKTMSSLHNNNGTKPKTPTKKTEHDTMIRNSATFSLHACFASFVGRMMHLFGSGKVMIQANELHTRPSMALLSLCSFDSGTDVELMERRVATVDCVPSDSDAQENLARGMSAADPAMERVFLEAKLE